MTLNVEYKVSLHESKSAGRWNINKDKGAITFNLPLMYASALKTVSKWKDETAPDYHDDIEELFLLHLRETELVERICIERAYQKIRLKGRSRCKPFCCIERPAMYMMYPDEWDKLNEWDKEQRAKEIVRNIA